MVTLHNRREHYIFAPWFLSSFFFIPRLISAVADWMSTITVMTTPSQPITQWLYVVFSTCFSSPHRLTPHIHIIILISTQYSTILVSSFTGCLSCWYLVIHMFFCILHLGLFGGAHICVLLDHNIFCFFFLDSLCFFVICFTILLIAVNSHWDWLINQQQASQMQENINCYS